LKQIATFRGGSQLRTWSMGIAINVVREMRRHASKLPDTDQETLGAIPQAQLAPLERASMSEERGALMEELERLPDRQREAIVLRFFEDLSVEETAAAMK